MTMKKFVKNNFIIIIVAIVLAVLAWEAWNTLYGEIETSSVTEGTKSTVKHRLGKATPVMRTPKNRVKKIKTEPILKVSKQKGKKIFDGYKLQDDGSVDYGEYDNFKGRDKIIAKTLDAAFWDNDKETALAAALEAVDSKNEELRQKAVERTSWFGVDGMDTLTHFFADKNEEIAEAAKEAWVKELGHIADDNVRVAMIEPMCKEVTDPSMVDGMLMSLNGMSNIAQMQVVISLMDTGTDEAAEVARNHYAFVTGEDFTTVEAAQAWLEANWEDEDEAHTTGTSTEEVQDKKFEKETYADINATAKELGVKPETLEKWIAADAKRLGLSGEKYIKQVNMSAVESRMSTAEYLSKQLKGVIKEEKGDAKGQTKGEGEN